MWEECFERSHGFLRGLVDEVVKGRGLLSQQRIELLDSWRRSGFSVHNRVFVHPRDGREFEALVRYMMRPPVSLTRLRFTPGSHEVVCAPKPGHDDIEPTEGERIDAMEFIARILVQIPDPRRHLVRYYGAHSNASRGKRKKAAASAEPSPPDQAPEDAAIPDGPYRAEVSVVVVADPARPDRPADFGEPFRA